MPARDRFVQHAEAVLQGAQGAVGALALALELQHAVDEVLEHARPGERALLGDVADEQDRGARLLRHPGDAAGDLAHLADRAGRAGQLGRVQRLHGVDDADLGPLDLERGHDGLEVGLGDDVVTTGLNFEFVYKFPTRSAWRLYAGGGPAVNFYSFDRDGADGDTETEGGLNFLFGAESSNGLFFEVKVGAIDSPDVKFGVGFTFR